MEKTEKLFWWFPGPFGHKGKTIALEQSRKLFWWLPGSFAQNRKTIAFEKSQNYFDAFQVLWHKKVRQYPWIKV